ncbi:hypothetical protein L7F22_068394 [Adiantum nelumboides]|nr:hypothetical protein [Adiantum nelumboides]
MASSHQKAKDAGGDFENHDSEDGESEQESEEEGEGEDEEDDNNDDGGEYDDEEEDVAKDDAETYCVSIDDETQASSGDRTSRSKPNSEEAPTNKRKTSMEGSPDSRRDSLSKKIRSSPDKVQSPTARNAGSPPTAVTARKTSIGTGGSQASTKSAKAQTDAVRKHATQQFAAIFESIFSLGESSDPVTEAAEYTKELEEALFDRYAEPVAQTTVRLAGKAYKDQLRAFIFNLKDQTNTTLRQRISSGALEAKQLAALSNAELANDKIREEVERRRRENLEQSILKKEKAPLRKITHKGEVDIEYDQGAEAHLAKERKLG